MLIGNKIKYGMVSTWPNSYCCAIGRFISSTPGIYGFKLGKKQCYLSQDQMFGKQHHKQSNFSGIWSSTLNFSFLFISKQILLNSQLFHTGNAYDLSVRSVGNPLVNGCCFSYSSTRAGTGNELENSFSLKLSP